MIYDVAIIGAGMAGASLAAALDPRLSVILIEAEDQPGYHATGRSAAFWDECYGGLDIQPLTTASGPFLALPPADFHDCSFLKPRGVLYIGQASDETELLAFKEKFANQGVALNWLGRSELLGLVSGLKDNWCHAVYGPHCSDIDVAGLHQAYLRQAKRNGAVLALRSSLTSAVFSKGTWTLQMDSTQVQARIIVNAAGAWVNDVASICGVRNIPHNPCRRTIAQVQTTPGTPAQLPLVIDHRGAFYFKPEGQGQLWLSPHDETPDIASDVIAEEMDVAVAIDRFEKATHWHVKGVQRSWAGLRTFSPDRKPVFGFDLGQPAYFWCTGQGGFGIQTAPAAAQLCAALIEQRAFPEALQGIDPTVYAPGRFT